MWGVRPQTSRWEDLVLQPALATTVEYEVLALLATLLYLVQPGGWCLK